MRGSRISDGTLDVPALFRLWATNVPQDEICARLGIRRGSLWEIRDRLKLPSRECDRPPPPTGKAGTDPTPAEIAQATAAIRETWHPEEEERRRGYRPVAVRQFAFRPRDYAAVGLDS